MVVMDEQNESMETMAVHGGERRPGPEGSVVYPIYQGTVYSVQPGTGYHDLPYHRLSSTPSQRYLHDKLAALEGAQAAVATASGMAAVTTTLLSVLRAGDHLLASDCLYGGTHDFLTERAEDLGWRYSFVDVHRPETWAAARTPLRASAGATAATIRTLEPGQGFTILQMYGNWWYVEAGEQTGWVDYRTCFINLPDVIPSIVYNTESIARSAGFDIPGMWDLQRFTVRAYNPRFGREMRIVPGKFSMALSLFQAQQTALAHDETILMYQAFRPRAAQTAAVEVLRNLIDENEIVRETINYGQWHIGWFVATGISNHQRGSAIDISLGTVHRYEYRRVGDFIYRHVLEHRAHVMPSRMHELSPWAALFDSPRTVTMQQLMDGSVTLAESANLPGVAALHRAIAGAGADFRPLASEWWHFDHTESQTAANNAGIQGEFLIETVYSRPPVAQ